MLHTGLPLLKMLRTTYARGEFVSPWPYSLKGAKPADCQFCCRADFELVTLQRPWVSMCRYLFCPGPTGKAHAQAWCVRSYNIPQATISRLEASPFEGANVAAAWNAKSPACDAADDSSLSKRGMRAFLLSCELPNQFDLGPLEAILPRSEVCPVNTPVKVALGVLKTLVLQCSDPWWCRQERKWLSGGWRWSDRYHQLLARWPSRRISNRCYPSSTQDWRAGGLIPSACVHNLYGFPLSQLASRLSIASAWRASESHETAIESWSLR